MTLEIRRAEREDAAAFLDLVQALAHYEKLDPPDEEARKRLIADGWGERPRYEAWLAIADGTPVAYAILFETYSSFLARPTLYLEDFFVLPDQRSRGIGYTLFKRLAQLALERDCGRMEWVCLDWNQLGRDFYAKVGASHLSDWITYRMLPEEIRRMTDDG